MKPVCSVSCLCLFTSVPAKKIVLVIYGVGKLTSTCLHQADCHLNVCSGVTCCSHAGAVNNQHAKCARRQIAGGRGGDRPSALGRQKNINFSTNSLKFRPLGRYRNG